MQRNTDEQQVDIAVLGDQAAIARYRTVWDKFNESGLLKNSQRLNMNFTPLGHSRGSTNANAIVCFIDLANVDQYNKMKDDIEILRTQNANLPIVMIATNINRTNVDRNDADYFAAASGLILYSERDSDTLRLYERIAHHAAASKWGKNYGSISVTQKIAHLHDHYNTNGNFDHYVAQKFERSPATAQKNNPPAVSGDTAAHDKRANADQLPEIVDLKTIVPDLKPGSLHEEVKISDAEYLQAEKNVLNELKDYTKGSGFMRFLTGHWNRHHVAAIDAIIKANQAAQSLEPEKRVTNLFKQILDLQPQNPNGDLAKLQAKLKQQYSAIANGVSRKPLTAVQASISFKPKKK